MKIDADDNNGPGSPLLVRHIEPRPFIRHRTAHQFGDPVRRGAQRSTGAGDRTQVRAERLGPGARKRSRAHQPGRLGAGRRAHPAPGRQFDHRRARGAAGPDSAASARERPTIRRTPTSPRRRIRRRVDAGPPSPHLTCRRRQSAVRTGGRTPRRRRPLMTRRRHRKAGRHRRHHPRRSRRPPLRRNVSRRAAAGQPPDPPSQVGGWPGPPASPANEAERFEPHPPRRSHRRPEPPPPPEPQFAPPQPPPESPPQLQRPGWPPPAETPRPQEPQAWQPAGPGGQWSPAGARQRESAGSVSWAYDNAPPRDNPADRPPSTAESEEQAERRGRHSSAAAEQAPGQTDDPVADWSEPGRRSRSRHAAEFSDSGSGVSGTPPPAMSPPPPPMPPPPASSIDKEPAMSPPPSARHRGSDPLSENRRAAIRWPIGRRAAGPPADHSVRGWASPSSRRLRRTPQPSGIVARYSLSDRPVPAMRDWNATKRLVRVVCDGAVRRIAPSQAQGGDHLRRPGGHRGGGRAGTRRPCRGRLQRRLPRIAATRRAVVDRYPGGPGTRRRRQRRALGARRPRHRTGWPGVRPGRHAAVRPGTIVVHTSGVNGIGVLAPLSAQDCIPLAIHPAMTFTGSDEDISRLPDTCFGITAADEVGYAIAQSLVLEIGGEPFRVPRGRADALSRRTGPRRQPHRHRASPTRWMRCGPPCRATNFSANSSSTTTRRHRRADRRTTCPRGAGEHAATRAGGAHRSDRAR